MLPDRAESADALNSRLRQRYAEALDLDRLRDLSGLFVPPPAKPLCACPAPCCAFYLGTDGKRRQADFIVPGDVAAHELADYLADLFHEDATPGHDSVTPLP